MLCLLQKYLFMNTSNKAEVLVGDEMSNLVPLGALEGGMK